MHVVCFAMRNADDNRYRTGDDPQFGGPIGWGEVKISIRFAVFIVNSS